MTFPIKLPWGGTLKTEAAYLHFLNVQKQRAKLPGYQGRICQFHLNELKTLTIEKWLKEKMLLKEAK